MIAGLRLHGSLTLVFLLCACAGRAAPEATIEPPGDPKTPKTRMLETGARVLQSNAPPSTLDVHLVGFHAAKEDPSHQMEAHHYCRQVNEDFAQCALYDGDAAAANLVGIEYIISEKLFEALPAQEKSYWHPHNYEILSGTLIGPGLPDAAEKAFMTRKMNSYGKTWHVWNSAPFGREGDRMPLGEAVLEWSFNRDGEALPAMIEARDRRMGLDTAGKRESRRDLVPLAHPQSGVDALKGRFDRPTQEIPGVMDEGAAR